MWLVLSSVCFVIGMLSVAVAYRFRAALFRCDNEPNDASWLKSITLGLLGGDAALIVASPTIWFLQLKNKTLLADRRPASLSSSPALLVNPMLWVCWAKVTQKDRLGVEPKLAKTGDRC